MTILKLSKWGNSHGIRLTKELLESLQISEEKVREENIIFDAIVNDHNLILTVKEEKTPLEKLFEGFKGNAKDYKVDFDWGEAVGNEVW